MHRTHGLVLSLGLFLLVASVRASNLSNGVLTSKQSYFFGAKDATDLLCFSRTLLKGSGLPLDINFTNPLAKNIKFVTVAADKYSPYGFTADISAGALRSRTLTLKLNGKSILPYSIEVKFYCAN